MIGLRVIIVSLNRVRTFSVGVDNQNIGIGLHSSVMVLFYRVSKYVAAGVINIAERIFTEAFLVEPHKSNTHQV